MGKTLTEMLGLVRRHPLFYLRVRSVTRLEAFVFGIMLARQPESLLEEVVIGDFTEWLPGRLSVAKSCSFAEMIIEVEGDEQAAFDRFFFLFDEYVALHAEYGLKPTAEYKA